jgi:hypothetical protein
MANQINATADRDRSFSSSYNVKKSRHLTAVAGSVIMLATIEGEKTNTLLSKLVY